jgi:hypothetical protein
MPTSRKRLAAGTATTVALLGTLVSTQAGPAWAQDAGESRAFGVSSTLVGGLVSPTPEAEYPGGPSEDSEASVAIGSYGEASSLAVAAEGDGTGTVSAESSVAAVDLSFIDTPLTDLTTGTVTAFCEARPGQDPVGAATIASGVFNVAGVPVDLATDPTPEANTEIVLPNLGTVVLNEQIETNGSLTVNAVHITLDPQQAPSFGGELIIGSATCEAGDEDDTTPPDPEYAEIIASAVESGTGEPVRGVTFGFYAGDALVEEQGELEAECVTDESGECGEDVPANDSYQVCVRDVPEAYQLPEWEDRCVGPYQVGPDDVVYARSVLLDSAEGDGDGDGDGDGSGDRGRHDRDRHDHRDRGHHGHGRHP